MVLLAVDDFQSEQEMNNGVVTFYGENPLLCGIIRKCGVCDATKNVWNVLHTSHRPRVAMNHGFCA